MAMVNAFASKTGRKKQKESIQRQGNIKQDPADVLAC